MYIYSYFNLYKKLRFNIYYDRSSNLNEYDKSFVWSCKSFNAGAMYAGIGHCHGL